MVELTTLNLAALQTGDNKAWEIVYDLLAADLLAFIRRVGGRDAEDILGETMLQMVRDIKKYSGDAAGLRPWAFRIARKLMELTASGLRPVISAVSATEKSAT